MVQIGISRRCVRDEEMVRNMIEMLEEHCAAGFVATAFPAENAQGEYLGGSQEPLDHL
jgi:hypothetical protein